MNPRTTNNRILTMTIACSVLLHFVGFWLFGSIDHSIRVELAGQRHINVNLVAAPVALDPTPQNTPSSAPSNALTETKLKKEATIASQENLPVKPKKLVSENPQMDKMVRKQLEANEPVPKKPEPARNVTKTAGDELVVSRVLGPETEPVLTVPAPSQENKIEPEPVHQAEPENPRDVHETAKREAAQENNNDPSKATVSAESEASSPSMPKIPRYQLGSTANPEPDYPLLARKKGWQGEVILGVHLEADGSIKHLTFVKSTDYGVLNHAAYETVRTQWRFDPLEAENAQKNNYIEIPISFRLD